MTHEITTNNGKASIAYKGAAPWHGLGQQQPEGVTWTRQEWQEQSDTKWSAMRANLHFHSAVTGQLEHFQERDVLYRSDNGYALGYVSPDYKIVQPDDAWSWVENVTKATGFEVETAGHLFGGKQLWWLMAVNGKEDYVVADKRDKIRPYLLAATSLDRSLPTQIMFTVVRVVCWNTLTESLGVRTADGGMRIKHRTTVDWTKVNEHLGLEINKTAKDQFQGTMDLFRTLAKTEMAEQQITNATAELFHPGAMRLEGGALDKVLKSKAVSNVLDLVLNQTAEGAKFKGVKNTAWGWLNGVTQYIDHGTKARTADARLESAWFGTGAQVKERAIQMCIKLADGSVSYRDVENSSTG